MTSGSVPERSQFEHVFLWAPEAQVLLSTDVPRYTILRANYAYARLVDRTVEELTGQPIATLFPQYADGHLQKLYDSLRYVIEHGEPQELPVQHVVPPADAGEPEFHWRSRNSPVYSAEGSLRGILHAVEDITGMVRADRDRDRFFGVATDLLIKVGFDGYFREVNGTCESILGWKPEHMIHQPWLSFIHPDDVDDTLRELKDVVTGLESYHFENRYRCRDGSYRWLRWKTQTVLEERLVYCAGSDITESRRLHNITEGQNEALERSVQGAPLPVILEGLVHTLEENSIAGTKGAVMLLSEDGRQLTFGAAPNLSKQFCRDLGALTVAAGHASCGTAAASGTRYLASDIATDPHWTGYRTLAVAHRLRSCWSTAIHSGTGQVLGTFALYCDRHYAPTPAEEHLVEIIARTAGVVIEREHNLNAKRRSQEQLIEARDAAEAASVAKSEFLANMSHEIRTPMNVVVGTADILRRHENLTPSQLELVETLQQSADSLLGLLSDLLDLSKIEARAVELDHTPFSLAALVDGITGMLHLRARHKGLTFTATGHHALTRPVVGDATRLRQVILNLVGNALKFTERGEVTLRCTGHPAGHDHVRLRIAVSDTGIGIPAAKVDAIFDKFTQADSSINRKFGGSGLGLSISRTLVGAMGGTLQVRSQPDRGSVFTVELQLPLAHEKDVPNTTLPPVAPDAPPPGRVLLVEDFEPNAFIAGRYLRAIGHAYDVARNGAEAVAMARRRRYAAILMDVQMPEMNGLEATAAIRRHERETAAPRTPIVAMTAHALRGDRERCLAAGMDAYLAKPFQAEYLERILRKLTRQAPSGPAR